MSRRTRKRSDQPSRRQALIFAALGDTTRLALLIRLGEAAPLSITELSQDSRLTRQAITKHLRVLQDAGLIRGVRQGRECRFQPEPKGLDHARAALSDIARQWDDALIRLKAFVEESK